MSEELALRRRLDVRNRRVLPGPLWGLLFFFFGSLVNSLNSLDGHGWPLAALGILTCAGALVALRFLLPLSRPDEPPRRVRARALAERFGQLLQGVLLLEYLLGVGWMAATG